MRRFAVRFLVASLFAVVVAPVLFAQRQPGTGGFGQGGVAMLVMNKSVQEELKLTPDQVSAFEKAGAELKEKHADKAKAAFETKDREKIAEVMKALLEDSNATVTKVAADTLKPEQTKRLHQIEIQQAGLRAFAREDVQKSLKLTDKQSAEVKSLASEVQKDIEEIMKEVRPTGGVRPDQAKMQEARKKADALNKEALEKISATLTDEQKKAWKDLTGEKFELKFERRPGA